MVLYGLISRIATVREQYLKNEFFIPGQGKIREFCGWPGKFRKDLESQGIGKSRNWKINGYGKQSPENLIILFKRGKDVLYHEIV